MGVVATALGALAAAAILPGRQRDPEKKASARVYPERTSTDLIK